MYINKNPQHQLAEMLIDSYLKPHRDCAGFICDQTKLFTEEDGTIFDPYPKQVHFMNLLKPQDRIVVVLKPRQCITGDSLIWTPLGETAIKKLYEAEYRKLCYSISEKNNIQKDKIIDIWEAGRKPVYKLKLKDHSQIIRCTSKHQFRLKDGNYKTLAEINLLNDNSFNTDIAYLTKNGFIFYSSIEYIKYDKEEMTYDLTTEKYHNYFANGINVHNSGFSTSIVGSAVYSGYFNLTPEICIFSKTRTQANKVLDRVKKAYKSMHPNLRPDFVKESEGLLELQNGVRIYSLSSNPDSARGFTGDVFIDEFGIYPVKDSYELYKSVYPSITKKGRIITVSTPKGKDGKFFDLATKSIDEINPKAQQKANKMVYKLSWKDVPFIVDAVNNKGLFDGLTQEEIDQEYNAEFTTSDEEPYFSEAFLMDYYVERDRILPTFRSYDDLGIPDDYMKDWNQPLSPAYMVKNNPDLQYLLDKYDRFVGSWDIASTNDDSVVKIKGRVRGELCYDTIGNFTLNSISSDTIEQAKYVRRLIDCFELDSFTGDYRGLGRGALDFLTADDGIINAERYLDIIIKFDSTKDNKINNYASLKNGMKEGNRKIRYDGDKYEKNMIKQYTHVFEVNGKLVKKNGKDDHVDADALCEESIRSDGLSQDAITII